jgi:hypothetical protein
MKSINVSNTAELQTAIEAGYTKDEIKIVQPDASAAVAAARKEGVEEGKVAGITEGKTLGAQAERDRITAINDLTLKGFEKERDAALSSGASANDFAVTQARAIKDRGVTVSAIKKDSTSASHAAPPADEEAAKAESEAGWDRIVAKYSGKAKA